MGAGTDLWISEGGEMAARFFEVLDCASHTNFVALNVKRAPEKERPPLGGLS
jgi:hypothetical protein